jgi:hypothetical protein
MPHLQPLVLGPPVGHQQVVDALVVDLQYGNAGGSDAAVSEY